MGLNDCDVLSEGKKADIIMIDMNKPSMQPENNIVRNIVYSGDNSCVKMTMINGKILYENGEFTTIDYAETRKKCAELLPQLA
jgi:5-methylthioadenosine/S-adenosylhomocysteine deaminase